MSQTIRVNHISPKHKLFQENFLIIIALVIIGCNTPVENSNIYENPKDTQSQSGAETVFQPTPTQTPYPALSHQPTPTSTPITMPTLLIKSPPFDGTLFISSEILNSTDPTVFSKLIKTKDSPRTMYDRRVIGSITVTPYIFEAIFLDGLTIEVQVNPEFENVMIAEDVALKYLNVIGQLPTVLRKDVETVWIHKGNQPFGGGNNNLLIHHDQGLRYETQGFLEEAFLHEASHTSLDNDHLLTPVWLQAQQADGQFISDYAKEFPSREDIAESFPMYFALRYKTSRIETHILKLIEDTIPNRIEYFDKSIPDLTQGLNSYGIATSESAASTPTVAHTPTPIPPAPISEPEYSVDIKILSIPDSWAILQPFFTKYITVFGINIFATEETPDHKIIHAANVLAQYLDNNANGSPDNTDVLEELVSNNASLIMSKDENQMESLWGDFPDAVHDLFDNSLGVQDLYGSETAPDNGFDASLEEILHLITHYGYSKAYPDVFGEQYDSEIANYMDTARGGRFVQVPSRYPSSAWYSYDDPTCDYSCMVTEYFYWALTSHLGAQMDPNRCEEIEHEWKLCSPGEIRDTDTNIHDLLTDTQYSLPSVIPNGYYRPVI